MALNTYAYAPSIAYSTLAYPASTTVMIGEQELPELLKALNEDVFDVSATLGKNEQLPVRLVGFRVDNETASRHRQNVYKTAQKHGRQPSKRQLALCDWAFYATNLPADEYDMKEI
ncbi:MAG: hypothetical protein LBJ67_01850, partial [Planctomycetaceae bacterium]|nr:hypothetical protein [Planctomycetaceae bacterium]